MEDFLIEYLLNEINSDIDYKQPDINKFRLFRALVNIRDNELPTDKFLQKQDKYLQDLIMKKGIVNYKDYLIQDNIYLLKCDITTLKVDAIVNAANSAMLGCYIQNHGCIDNTIHTFSGVQLRDECRRIMKGNHAKNSDVIITSAYNLPSKYIIHTVGPIVYGNVTKQNEEDLANCYKNVIELAIEKKLNSIAICCISTGEFCYPNQQAALIALDVIKQYKNIDIIINVFKDEDYEIYSRLLKN